MAKDPAFLFYYDRFQSGTMTMTDAEVGQYMRLMCVQANKGYLTLKQIERLTNSPDVADKFREFEPGKFANDVLSEIMNQRKAYTESRRSNRNKGDNTAIRLYLMIDHMSGHIKIGSSNKPERRLLEIRSSNKNEKIDLLWTSDETDQSNESLLHRKFKDKCIVNEWFSLSEIDILEIKSIYKGTSHMIGHMVNVNKDVNIIVDITDKEAVTKSIFGDELFIADLVRNNPGKDLKDAWEQCWLHFSQQPNKLVEWEWRQKLSSWLIRYKSEKNGKKKSFDIRTVKLNP